MKSKLLTGGKSQSAVDINLKDRDKFDPSWAQSHLAPHPWAMSTFTFRERGFDDNLIINHHPLFLAYNNSLTVLNYSILCSITTFGFAELAEIYLTQKKLYL